MKMRFPLALALVLAIGTGALGADVTVHGDIGLTTWKPAGMGLMQFVEYGANIDAALSDETSAKLELRNNWVDHEARFDFAQIATAQTKTKLGGLGTLSVGINPDYGTSPFETTYFDDGDFGLNAFWGRSNNTPAFSLATEKSGGFAAQFYANLYDPAEQNDAQLIAAELTYDLPQREGATVGLVLDKWDEDDSVAWAFIGQTPVTDHLSVYGEVGGYESWITGESPTAVAMGVRTELGKATVHLEGSTYDDLDPIFWLTASYPCQDITYSAMYWFGDWGDELDGMWIFSAKVGF